MTLLDVPDTVIVAVTPYYDGSKYIICLPNCRQGGIETVVPIVRVMDIDGRVTTESASFETV